MARTPLIGFVHIPKTGGSTLKFILRNSTFFRHCDLQPLARSGIFSARDFAFMKTVFFFGVHTISGHSLRPFAVSFPEPVRYFTMIRDPYQRCLSHYQHIKRAWQRLGRDITFEDFIRNEKMTNVQVQRICGSPDLDEARKQLEKNYFFVGLTERFAESVTILRRLFPWPLVLQYQRLHITRDHTAREDVLNSESQMALLRQGNRLDLALYHFVRDELYPAFREKAELQAREIDEKEHALSGSAVRNRITRIYNHAVYRNLNKFRRRLNRQEGARGTALPESLL